MQKVGRFRRENIGGWDVQGAGVEGWVIQEAGVGVCKEQEVEWCMNGIATCPGGRLTSTESRAAAIHQHRPHTTVDGTPGARNQGFRINVKDNNHHDEKEDDTPGVLRAQLIDHS